MDGTTAAAQAAAAWMVETAGDSVANMSSLTDGNRDKLSHASHLSALDNNFRERTDCISRPLSRTTE